MGKTISFILIMAFACFGFISCGFADWMRENNIDGNQKPGIGVIDHVNKSIKMDYVDKIPSLGITIIRFIDAGHTRYIAIRDDSISVLSTTSIGGKNPTYEDDSISTK